MNREPCIPMTEVDYQESLNKLISECTSATQMMFLLDLKRVHEEIKADVKLNEVMK